MDLAEVKHWNKYKGNCFSANDIRNIDWLVAECESLTALCDEYRGEIEFFKAELAVKCQDCNRNDAFDENTTLRAEIEQLKAELADAKSISAATIGHQGSLLESATGRAESAESALTRARAEGMEESAIKVDELKATLEDLSMHSPHALEDNAYSRAAYEAELTAAAIRAAKGEQ